MKKLLCALFLCLSLPVSALPPTVVVTQASLGLSAFLSLATGSTSIDINGKTVETKKELNRALQNITCSSLNCTDLIVHDVNALKPMIDLQFSAWVTSILQIIPDFLVFVPILIGPYLLPQRPELAVALAALVWVQGTGTWILTMIYTKQASEGSHSYCNNSCEDYRPYLDFTKFLDLELKAEYANIRTTTAYELSIAHGVIRILSAVIPLTVFGAYRYFRPRTGEMGPLNA